jgi:hypothetical protein
VKRQLYKNDGHLPEEAAIKITYFKIVVHLSTGERFFSSNKTLNPRAQQRFEVQRLRILHGTKGDRE